MRIEWLKGATVPIACPVCRSGAVKPAVLAVDSPWTGQRLTLVECPECGAHAFDDLMPPSAIAPNSDSALKFYVEQGAGIDVMLGPLFRVPRERVKRYLEIGCGFGFALDFARWAFGWQTRGIDPSPLARAGREHLQLDIVPTYLTSETDVGGPFDLIFCSEVIEHVANPHEFLAAVRQQLGADGTLALTTPNAALIKASAFSAAATQRAALLSALSAGHHLVLFSAAALEGLLRMHGFPYVNVWATPHTLHAVASRRPYQVAAEATVDRVLYRDYLETRARTTAIETPLGLGFAYRLFKEEVNANHPRAALAVFERLRAACTQLYGLDLTAPGRLRIEPDPPRDLESLARAYPFNLTGLLFFQGIVQLNHLNAPARARDYFEAAVRAGTMVRMVLRSIGADDGETEDLVEQGRSHALWCLAQFDPSAAAEMAAQHNASEVGSFDGLMGRARDEAFVRLVNAGRYAEAERLAGAVARAREVTGRELSPSARDRLESGGDPVLNSLFCLGILTLNHRGDAAQAAQLLGLVHDLARVACVSGGGSPTAKILVWQARYCQALALKQAGEHAACTTAVETLIANNVVQLPPVPADLRASARALLRPASY